MEEIISKRQRIYLSRYGIVPEFKAAIHGGQAVVTSVGKLKKELVYHGDVLNTTSRIAGKCHELKEKLLVSEDLLKYLDLNDFFRLEEKGQIELKGKMDKLSVFGVKPFR
jgi:adenylate cyclase